MIADIFFFLLWLLAIWVIYVRLAPSSPARWHVAPPDRAKRFKAGVVEIIPGNIKEFSQLSEIAAKTPRTRRLAGSVDEGRVTYITRTPFWGFPDYTTLALSDDDQITLYARLRFGKSDSGVNAARIGDWLKRLEALKG